MFASRSEGKSRFDGEFCLVAMNAIGNSTNVLTKQAKAQVAAHVTELNVPPNS